MPIAPDSPEFKQLMLNIEVDLFSLTRMRLLLAEDDIQADLLAQFPPLMRRTIRDCSQRPVKRD